MFKTKPWYWRKDPAVVRNSYAMVRKDLWTVKTGPRKDQRGFVKISPLNNCKKDPVTE